MDLILNIIAGLILVGLLILIIWATKHPQKSKEISWLAPVRFYLTHQSLRKWTINIIGALLILWVGNFYIHWIQPAITPATMFPPPFNGPMAVNVEKVTVGPVVNVATYTGSVQPWQSNKVLSRVDGFVESMQIYPGDFVHKGETLAQLDLSQLRPALDKAIADSAYRFSEYQRAKKLYRDSVITPSDFDNYKRVYKQSVAQVQQMQADLQYATIKSGLNGYVAKRFIYPGDYVKKGMPLFRIDQLARVRIQFTVSENDLPYIHPGDRVLLTSPAFSREVFKRYPEWQNKIHYWDEDGVRRALLGKLKSGSKTDTAGTNSEVPKPYLLSKVAVVFPQEDSATHTGVVEIRLTNPSILFKTDSYIIGKFATAGVDSTLRVPTRAIISLPENEAKGVYLAPALSEQGFAQLRKITVGMSGSRYTQVLSGVKPDDYVIYAGQKDLTNGMSVVVLNRKNQ